MEKKRRDRINQSLEQLKELLLGAVNADVRELIVLLVGLAKPLFQQRHFGHVLVRHRDKLCGTVMHEMRNVRFPPADCQFGAHLDRRMLHR